MTEVCARCLVPSELHADGGHDFEGIVAVVEPFTLDISRIVTTDEEAVEAYVDSLPREAVVLALHLAERIRKALSQFTKMSTSRVVADEILSPAEVWTSPEGVDYFWSGSRSREVRDPKGLKAALGELPLDTIALRAYELAFKPQADKVYLSELDRIVKNGPPEAKDIVNDFAVWKESTPHLRPVEEEKR